LPKIFVKTKDKLHGSYRK